MPEHEAQIEIKNLSLNARYYLQDNLRGHLQVILALAEHHHDIFLPQPEQKRLAAIREAVTVMSEDLRRMGL